MMEQVEHSEVPTDTVVLRVKRRLSDAPIHSVYLLPSRIAKLSKQLDIHASINQRHSTYSTVENRFDSNHINQTHAESNHALKFHRIATLPSEVKKRGIKAQMNDAFTTLVDSRDEIRYDARHKQVTSLRRSQQNNPVNYKIYTIDHNNSIHQAPSRAEQHDFVFDVFTVLSSDSPNEDDRVGVVQRENDGRCVVVYADDLKEDAFVEDSDTESGDISEDCEGSVDYPTTPSEYSSGGYGEGRVQDEEWGVEHASGSSRVDRVQKELRARYRFDVDQEERSESESSSLGEFQAWYSSITRPGRGNERGNQEMYASSSPSSDVEDSP
mmetsp:Transcript_10914/g.19725  ORF Transcript_10914/g.19725 Transcript_10914/m.19725 type:complete len:326 (-) Transcript_10914:407-1384(-)